MSFRFLPVLRTPVDAFTSASHTHTHILSPAYDTHTYVWIRTGVSAGIDDASRCNRKFHEGAAAGRVERYMYMVERSERAKKNEIK